MDNLFSLGNSRNRYDRAGRNVGGVGAGFKTATEYLATEGTPTLVITQNRDHITVAAQVECSDDRIGFIALTWDRLGRPVEPVLKEEWIEMARKLKQRTGASEEAVLEEALQDLGRSRSSTGTIVRVLDVREDVIVTDSDVVDERQRRLRPDLPLTFSLRRRLGYLYIESHMAIWAQGARVQEVDPASDLVRDCTEYKLDGRARLVLGYEADASELFMAKRPHGLVHGLHVYSREGRLVAVYTSSLGINQHNSYHRHLRGVLYITDAAIQLAVAKDALQDCQEKACIDDWVRERIIDFCRDKQTTWPYGQGRKVERRVLEEYAKRGEDPPPGSRTVAARQRVIDADTRAADAEIRALEARHAATDAQAQAVEARQAARDAEARAADASGRLKVARMEIDDAHRVHKRREDLLKQTLKEQCVEGAKLEIENRELKRKIRDLDAEFFAVGNQVDRLRERVRLCSSKRVEALEDGEIPHS